MSFGGFSFDSDAAISISVFRDTLEGFPAELHKNHVPRFLFQYFGIQSHFPTPTPAASGPSS